MVLYRALRRHLQPSSGSEVCTWILGHNSQTHMPQCSRFQKTGRYTLGVRNKGQVAPVIRKLSFVSPAAPALSEVPRLKASTTAHKSPSATPSTTADSLDEGLCVVIGGHSMIIVANSQCKDMLKGDKLGRKCCIESRLNSIEHLMPSSRASEEAVLRYYSTMSFK